MKTIKFIYFDVGGVLLNWEKSLVKLAEKHNKTQKKVFDIFYKYDPIFARGTHTADEMTKIMQKDLQIDDKNFDYIAYCSSQFIPIPEMHELVHELKHTHKIGLLTNLHTDTFDFIMQYGSVPDIDYHAIIKSYEVGFIKPEPEIYHIAQKKAGVAHEEILFIDDLAVNVEAAKKLGWQGYVFDKQNSKKAMEAIRQMLRGSRNNRLYDKKK